MTVTGRPPQDLLETALPILEEADAAGVPLRLCGGVACWYRSASVRDLFEERLYSDLDFAARNVDRRKIEELFGRHGFCRDRAGADVPGRKRVSITRGDGVHADVFYDHLEFNHTIDLTARLELERHTVTVTDLLLQKLQIVNVTRKDLVDAAMLTGSYEIARNGDRRLDCHYIAQLCARDWGFYKTVSDNVLKIVTFVQREAPETLRGGITSRLLVIMTTVEAEKKRLRWRIRALVGTRWPWFEVVDDAEEAL